MKRNERASFDRLETRALQTPVCSAHAVSQNTASLVQCTQFQANYTYACVRSLLCDKDTPPTASRSAVASEKKRILNSTARQENAKKMKSIPNLATSFEKTGCVRRAARGHTMSSEFESVISYQSSQPDEVVGVHLITHESGWILLTTRSEIAIRSGRFTLRHRV
jgi:hypothetical protein